MPARTELPEEDTSEQEPPPEFDKVAFLKAFEDIEESLEAWQGSITLMKVGSLTTIQFLFAAASIPNRRASLDLTGACVSSRACRARWSASRWTTRSR